MNKNFIVTNGNTEKQANSIIKFSFQTNDYLIYYIDENEEQAQIFVSKLQTNTEGKKFIEQFDLSLKSKLNSLVYNIVVKLVIDFKKGEDATKLISELETREEIKISNDLPTLSKQEYLPNSSVAITTKALINESTELFGKFVKPAVEEPVWLEVKEVKTEPISVMPQVEDKPIIANTLPSSPVSPVASPLPAEPVLQQIPTPATQESPVVSEPIQNPQTEILNSAVNSDPNLTAVLPNVQSSIQPNIGKINGQKAGFANTKYIIIGTVCLLLSVVVVIVAIILIKNK